MRTVDYPSMSEIVRTMGDNHEQWSIDDYTMLFVAG